MVPFERALVSFYRPSIVTFPLSLRVSEILSLLFSSMPPFPYPTSSLPKFPHVPMGVGGSPFGCNERRCWANRLCSQFPRFLTYVITNHQRHRRTDGQTTCDRKTALCTKVHCAVKNNRQQSDCFNNYFCTVGEKLSSNIVPSEFRHYLQQLFTRGI